MIDEVKPQPLQPEEMVTTLEGWREKFAVASDMPNLVADLGRAGELIAQQAQTIDRRNATYRKPGEGWVCFHCGERFTDYESAKEHFGEKPDADARCIEEARREQPVRVTDAMAEAAHVVLSESCAVVFTGDYAEALSITTRAIVSALAAAPKEGEE